jgi:hypothetical protein
VEVLPVHPAYTSTIGAVNYTARFGISLHQGAAIAIARRGLALSERPAVRVAQLSTRQGGHVTFPYRKWNRGQQVENRGACAENKAVTDTTFMSFRGPSARADMYGRSGRRSPGRCERRLQRLFSCFPPWREVHPRCSGNVMA